MQPSIPAAGDSQRRPPAAAAVGSDPSRERVSQVLMQAASAPARYRMLGVLGGMGALATVDFLHKLVLATPATRDQEHVPMLVRFCPEVPDRVDALLRNGPSPEPALVAAARGLEQAGARGLAIPCNTAHAWWDGIAAAVSIPVLHIADAALAAAAATGPVDEVGLLATSGTLRGGIYRARGGPGLRWIVPTEAEQAQWVTPGIKAVKDVRLAEAAEQLALAAEALARRGARVIVMGCTEIPLALAGRDVGVPLIDSTLALAQACVAWAGAGEPVGAPATR